MNKTFLVKSYAQFQSLNQSVFSLNKYDLQMNRETYLIQILSISSQYLAYGFASIQIFRINGIAGAICLVFFDSLPLWLQILRLSLTLVPQQSLPTQWRSLLSALAKMTIVDYLIDLSFSRTTLIKAITQSHNHKLYC